MADLGAVTRVLESIGEAAIAVSGGVDSMTLAPPVYGLDQAKVLNYAMAIAQTFYGS